MIVKVKGKAVKLNGKWCYKGETENITLEQYEGKEKYLEIIPLTVIPDGNVKYGAYSNYAKGKKYYTPKK